MKKILLILFFILFFFHKAIAGTYTMADYAVYPFFGTGAPGATENDIANSGIIQATPDNGGLPLIFDTNTGNAYLYKSGSNGSYVWWQLGQVTPTINNNPGRSLVSVAAAANGFQVSSSRPSTVHYSVTITTAVQIGVTTNVEGYVIIETAATNSSTAGDWTEVARISQAQNIGLAVALSSTQKGGGELVADIPAGYYVRIRTVNVAGTPTYTPNSQSETTW